MTHGAAGDGVRICAPHGPQITELPTPHLAGPDVPGSGAIMRPALARILAEATRAAGVRVHLGQTFDSIAPDAEGVDVVLNQRPGEPVRPGDRCRWPVQQGPASLVPRCAGASVQRGQGVWRAVLPRPPGLDTITMWMGPHVKPGANPVSKDEVDPFVTEPRPRNDHVGPPPPLSIISRHCWRRSRRRCCGSSTTSWVRNRQSSTARSKVCWCRCPGTADGLTDR